MMDNNSNNSNNDEDHEDLQDLFLEDWDGIFDEDGNGEGHDAGPDDEQLMGSLTPFEDSDPNDTTGGDGRDRSGSDGGAEDGKDDKGDVGGTGKKAKSKDAAKKRRSSKAIENAARTAHMRPPSWHSEAADRPHRQAMILEVARLLQIRKKTQPTKEWLQQLPHKARKLEERLYRNATSLEAYLDRNTLKSRLKKLARIITKQFLETKRLRGHQHFKSLRSSETSFSTASTAARVSFASSIASSRDSMMSRGSMTSSASMESLRRNLRDASMSRSSILSTASELNPDEQRRKSSLLPESMASVLQNSSVLGLPLQQQQQQISLNNSQVSLGEGSGSVSNNSISNNTAMNDNSGGSGSPGMAPASSSAANHGQSPTNMLAGQPANNSNTNAIITNNESQQKQGPYNVSELERQKAVNAQLEKQIMENIRQQEEMVRQMQGRGTPNGGPSQPQSSTLPGQPQQPPGPQLQQQQQQQTQVSQLGTGGAGAASANSAAALTSALQAAAARNQMQNNLMAANTANQQPPHLHNNPNFMAAQNSFFNPALAMGQTGQTPLGQVAFPPGFNNQMMQFMQPQANMFGQPMQPQLNWGTMQGFGQTMMNNNMNNPMLNSNTILPGLGAGTHMTNPTLNMTMPPPPNPQLQPPATTLSRQQSAGAPGPQAPQVMNGMNNNNMMACPPNGAMGPPNMMNGLPNPMGLVVNPTNGNNNNSNNGNGPLSPNSFR